MDGPSVKYGTAARVDDTSETVWQAVANSDIAYFQLNITDFSLIGSQYATGSTLTSPQIIDMSITGEYVFVLMFANEEGLLMNINSTNSNVIWIVSNDINTLLISLLAVDSYINIIESQLYNNSRYAIHNEIDPSLGISLYPTFKVNMTSSFQFSETNDAKYSLLPVTPYENSIHYPSKSLITPAMRDGASAFTIVTDLSYIISIPDKFIQNITVTAGQNYTEYITLPCSIDTYDNLKYSIYDNGVDEVPTWVTFDSVNLALDIRVPVTNQASNHTYMIKTTYPEGTIINYFYIFVIE